MILDVGADVADAFSSHSFLSPSWLDHSSIFVNTSCSVYSVGIFFDHTPRIARTLIPHAAWHSSWSTGQYATNTTKNNISTCVVSSFVNPAQIDCPTTAKNHGATDDGPPHPTDNRGNETVPSCSSIQPDTHDNGDRRFATASIRTTPHHLCWCHTRVVVVQSLGIEKCKTMEWAAYLCPTRHTHFAASTFVYCSCYSSGWFDSSETNSRMF